MKTFEIINETDIDMMVILEHVIPHAIKQKSDLEFYNFMHKSIYVYRNFDLGKFVVGPSQIIEAKRKKECKDLIVIK